MPSKLTKPPSARKMRGSPSGATRVGKKRTVPKATGTPSNQLARFLNAQLDSRKWTITDFRQRLGQHGCERTDEAIGKWLQGNASPKYDDLPAIATVFGYASWATLCVAAERFE